MVYLHPLMLENAAGEARPVVAAQLRAMLRNTGVRFIFLNACETAAHTAGDPISGVARSYNYYPTGGAKPEQGVVNLALGLGKTIVDGGLSWNYCPAFRICLKPFLNLWNKIKARQHLFNLVECNDLHKLTDWRLLW